MTSGLSGRKASAPRRHARDVRSPRRPGTARISDGSGICPSWADQYGSRSPLVAGNVATRLLAVHLHRATAWDGGPSRATDTACGRNLAPAGSRRRRSAGRKTGRSVGSPSRPRHGLVRPARPHSPGAVFVAAGGVGPSPAAYHRLRLSRPSSLMWTALGGPQRRPQCYGPAAASGEPEGGSDEW